MSDDVYTRLFRDSQYSVYPNGSPRLDYVLAWVKRFVPALTDAVLGSMHVKTNCVMRGSVLDFGCGRGYLLRKLLPLGYDCHGYDSCEWLRTHDLDDLVARGVKIMSELYPPFWLPPNKFDCVIASDVLEHLPTEADAVDLLAKLVGVSKKWVIVTVGIGPSNTHANLPGTSLELHTVLKPDRWWEKRIAKHLEIVEKAAIKKSVLYLGRKK